MAQILDNITKIKTLTQEEQAFFLPKTETKHYKAKTIILNAGEVCKYSYFVNSGLLRSFNINDNIVEHVLSFACEGWWIGDMYSLLSQKPGNLFIEVLEDAEVVLLSKKNQEQLYLEIPKLERFFQNHNRKFFGCQSGKTDGQLEFNSRRTLRKILQKISNINSKSTSKTNRFLYWCYS